jgi:hypothetical protein
LENQEDSEATGLALPTRPSACALLAPSLKIKESKTPEAAVMGINHLDNKA